MSAPTHVVVIGAGITGALIAHRLIARGIAVTVVEAKERGAGSSSRSAACIRQQFSTPATVRAMRFAVAAYARFAQEFACEGPDGDVLVQNGYLFLYDRPEVAPEGVDAVGRWRAAQDAVRMQRAEGLAEVEVLGPDAVKERFEQVDASRLLGATWCPTDGFLRADLVYQEGLRRVVELGGRLLQQAAVVGPLRDGGRLAGVRLSTGDAIPADVVINATNAWAPRVSRALGGAELPIEPVRRYLYMLRGDGRDLRPWPMIINGSRAYCRPENAQQLLLGFAHRAAPEPDFAWEDQDRIEPAFFHRSGVDNHGFATWLNLAESMPALEGFAGLEATVAGYYAMTPDRNPLIGFDPVQPGLIHAAGFSGHGAMMGPFTARAVEALVVAGRDLEHVDCDGIDVPLGPLLPDRRFDDAEAMVI